ncbi:Gfo/Idh/MocA family protein [Cellulomonas sp. P22]|uniref:Gfo/Idh/MocA family protein n=1 Tax=Cellulomonas sp. P22 TaxID=3373189 RepID=UPI00379A5571
MSEPMRVGLVGYGAAGRKIHARLLREAHQKVTVVVSRSPERSAAARADWPGVAVVPTLAALLDRAPELDVVVIASPTAEHADQAQAVLDAGLPVVVDKPLATTSDAARRLARAAERSGGRLTVFQNRRWDPEQLTLRAVIDSGELGTVHRFERRWERWRPEPQQRWKENDLLGGGLLLDLGAHLVDSAVHLFGPVTSVYAELRAITTPTEDDVFLALTHQHAGGAPGVISHLQASGLAGAPGPRTRVLGDRGAFLVTSFEGEATPFAALDEQRPGRGHGPETEGWLVRGDELVAVPRAPGGHRDFYRAVVHWLEDGAPPPVDPWDAVRTAAVLDAARVSAREGRVVPIGAATTA